MAVVRLQPGRKGAVGGSAGGPDDPSIAQRVSDLESKIDRIEAILERLEPKITEVLLTGAKAVDLAEVKGRISSLPTWWMLLVTLLSTWTVGAGIAFTVAKAAHP